MSNPALVPASPTASAAPQGLQLQLLGPVVLRRDGQPVPLPTHKAQALLALLALGGPTHRARLAGWLWPDVDDPSARRNLRRELARLRDAGVADALHSEGEMLALDASVPCDAQAFRQATQAHRHEEALRLWRGPPAEGLELNAAPSWAEWLAGERQQLQQERRRALAGAAQAAEARGDHATALSHVQALLADDPLQEHHHREAMRLLAVTGQRAAALAQYQRCRQLLAEELDLQPASETQALWASLRERESGSAPLTQHAQARASDAAARPAAAHLEGSEPEGPLPRQLPLVGREAAWAQLQAAWQAGRTLVIEGEAGVGKTRLACDFAASQGAYALAQCRRSDAGVPYAAFTRALRKLAGDTLAQADLPDWVRTELAHVLPELQPADAPRPLARHRSAPGIVSAEEQRRFFEACAAAWRALSADSFDTVLIDDWHLADEASRALLGFVIEQQHEALHSRQTDGSAFARTLIVLRPELQASAQRGLRALLDDPGTLHLVLPPLGSEQVFQLVQRLSGAPEPRRFAARLEKATGGNPFFVAETLRQWQGLQLLSVGPDGVWQTPFDGATPDYRELPLPDSVRDAVIARVQHQPEAVRRLLEAATLAAEPFTPALLAGACALSEVEALAAIEQAVADDLLRERDGGYAFVHDLVQHALDSALAPQRRRLVHRRLALGAESSGMAPADIALHWEAGGEPQRAVAHRIAAAESALALYADHDAEAHWQQALAQQPTPVQRVRIQGQRWPMLRHRDDHPGLLAAVADLEAARALALQDDSPAAADAALDASLHAAEILSFIHRETEALERLQACLAEPALGPARRAQALRIQSQALSRLGRTEEASQVTEQALAAGGLSPVQQGELLHALSYTCFLRGQPVPSLAYARRALVFWQAAGARRLVARAHASIGRSLDMLDEQDAAWAELEKAYALASELRLVGLQREVANNLANNRINLGEPARAIAVINEAWALSPHFSMAAMPVYFLGILLHAHFQLGELGRALELSEDARQRALALDDAMTLADHACMALDVHVLCGDLAGAQTVADGLQALGPQALEGLGYIRVKVAFGLVLLALAQGDLPAAQAHLQAIGPPDALEQPADVTYARLRTAQVSLAAGDAAQALAQLQPLQGQRLYPEIAAVACTTRLLARLALGQTATNQEAAEGDQLLANPGLPALDALALRQARLAAAECEGDVALAQALRLAIQRQTQALADQLDTPQRPRPAWRAAFLARWGA